MVEKLVITGNEGSALAFKQIEPDVVAAYPITPQTELMHNFARYIADGLIDTDLITVESEHSAMSACVGAASAGARVMTATSANGFALMWEILYIAASSRLPIVMAVVNRALSAPINIHCDHSDTMGGRDTGWIQFYAENTQEAYDLLITAVPIAEHPDVQLPVMVCYDGFIISHTNEVVEVLDDKTVKDFVGEYKPRINILDTDNPFTFGPLDFHDYYIEHKRQQVEGMKHAYNVIPEVFKKYEDVSGRRYEYFEKYRFDDADVVMVVLSSTAGTAKVVVDELRGEGLGVGLLKPRVFRPFPHDKLREALKDKKSIVVLDRSDSFGAFGGPLFTEIRSALYGIENPPEIIDFIYGLGGRNITKDELKTAFMKAVDIAEGAEVKNRVDYLGVRE
ncbi:MAG TPA: pyruvate ferredoxin oxidoreductase [Firmicutes bacterium]|uniref:Pyruvate ferredoxin oxidoreductase n=1 Tax=Candidatus Coatesbacteria bacterium 4484_99 TaxID=1970774 RepID=A0A1W9S2L4_9BACT|nr:MAG: pyruvate ferredoxin oxidoreductase [Candidatus Coatesbacteria bacterium 4484_99]RLC41595.1 MAG: pyruvate ferredoxin oxidoreductase [Candidatus Coatesbacteria bacterium]RLC43716.1 MAG: pyruvate ferredoxin oxidoreductase [Candidatus Coatesbacteria bacterium]RLC44572.1 MAG: pyruvate ferredoxin oxidoreductase [Candidatus Coatesbacteria bacterium]HDM43250.1 pyruvate ferredoxin oxidoreductase [Bacillota bacterium]